MMKHISSNTFIPMPVMLIGTMHNGKPNFMPVGWITRVNAQPPMIGIGIYKGHATPIDIEEHREFSICMPGQELLEKVDYCGLVSARKDDKSGVFNTFTNELKFAPMIEECVLCMECKLVNTVELPSNKFFIGEIVAAYARSEMLTDDKPDLAKMHGMVLSMPDNTYWSIGEPIGTAWEVGRKWSGAAVAAGR
ncbi:MAG TPA: flavin reductase family protein [Candidatus Ozemobacteraceae bacterium]|nr:flavin reductase family protein [Candidatus Ozemobacteraceae bacterium]